MERIKFVLINPTSPGRRAKTGERPPGSRVFRFSMLPSLAVAASMPPHVDTRIVDEEVEPVDYDVDADLVGITFMTYNAPRAYKIARRFREDKGMPVIVGGYHPTLMPEEATQYADAVCVGDAEPSVPRMIDDFSAGRLQPVYECAPAPLSNMPVPRRDLLRKQDYAPIDVVQATRGCYQGCSFCSVAAFHRGQFRARPVGEVVDELKGLGRYVLFMDDNIAADRDYALDLFAAVEPLGKLWFSQTGIGIAEDEELLGLAARSGCRGLFIGFESLSQPGLQSWGKRANLGKDYRAAVRRLHAAGIWVNAAFVFGGDEDGPDVFARTLEFLLEVNVEVLQATRLTPFPGTPLFKEMDGQGRILDKDWSHYDFDHVVFEPAHMSRETLDQGVAWVKREFYARRRIAHRTWRAVRYLDPGVILKAILPLNQAYRHNLANVGKYDRAAAFEPRARSWPRRGARVA